LDRICRDDRDVDVRDVSERVDCLLRDHGSFHADHVLLRQTLVLRSSHFGQWTDPAITSWEKFNFVTIEPTDRSRWFLKGMWKFALVSWLAVCLKFEASEADAFRLKVMISQWRSEAGAHRPQTDPPPAFTRRLGRLFSARK